MKTTKVQRKPLQETARYKNLVAVRDFIYSNGRMFTPTSEINIESILTALDITVADINTATTYAEAIKLHRKWLSTVHSVQAMFNDVLGQRGKNITRRRNTWVVRDNASTVSRIEAMNRTGTGFQRLSAELNTNYQKHHGRLNSRVSNIVLADIAAGNVASRNYNR